MSPDTPIAVVDFETTGMGPAQGARATEIAVVLVQDGRIVDRYQSLMYTGVYIPSFIVQLTGITNAMLQDAPPAEQVMREVAVFTRGLPLVAHNAAFDRGFWQAEMARADVPPDPAHAFACTVLLSRRLYPEAPSRKLGALGDWLGLERDGRAHRAMSDADLTAQLLIRLQRDVERRFAAELGERAVDHALLERLQRAQRQQLARCIAQA
ncbi:3'-5' exonuclease [Ideonella sp. 4Y16]|uniref:3'-5' exonuclease n=1 Tax=Ideonella alba TaxID=2824118 RepID=UPI001B36E4E7|nr:3'-5' exonuclease [Ideonella alba]MBQ0944706.1 3'-5' exonuclease [Ideonella alba]